MISTWAASPWRICSKIAHAGDARGETLLHRTESVAEAHSAHAQLFDLCEYLADRDRLCQHMSAGALCRGCCLWCHARA